MNSVEQYLTIFMSLPRITKKIRDHKKLKLHSIGRTLNCTTTNTVLYEKVIHKYN